MKIKVTQKNAQAIEAALSQVNGSARQHVFRRFQEIVDATVEAEKALTPLLFKKDFKKARFVKTSGGRVPNSYKYKRRATMITLERNSKGWSLVKILQITIYNEPSPIRLILTLDQTLATIKKLVKQFSIAEGKELLTDSFIESLGVAVEGLKTRAGGVK